MEDWKDMSLSQKIMGICNICTIICLIGFLCTGHAWFMITGLVSLFIGEMALSSYKRNNKQKEKQ